jgi:type II secretory pathway component GspD/PulD (secretin)
VLQPEMINFRDAAVPQVLAVYKTLTQMKLIIDSRVEKILTPIWTPITLKNERPLSEEQAAKLIEQALLEQAAIVITRLDKNRVSVTYNDALPIVSKQKAEKK